MHIYFAVTYTYTLRISSHILHVYDFNKQLPKLISPWFLYALIYVLEVARLRSCFKHSLSWKVCSLEILFALSKSVHFSLYIKGEDTLKKNLHISYIEQTDFCNFCCYNMPLKHFTILKFPNSVLKVSYNCSDNTFVRVF